MKDYHWKESFQSLGDALDRLQEVLDMPLDEHRVVLDATIQRFEFTFELFWKTLKRFLYLEGVETKSPRETLKMAYQLKWLNDEQLWLNMLRDRNETSHVYDEDKAKEIYNKIKQYYPHLRSIYQFLKTLQ